MRRCALGLLALLSTTGLAPAAELPATPQGAEAIKASLSRYLGRTATGSGNYVQVTPADATSYRATVDLTPLVSGFAAMGKGNDLRIQPQPVRLAENDDGTWRVTMDGLTPVAVTMGDKNFSFRMDGFKFDGTWDPRIMSFTTAAQEHSSFARAQVDGTANTTSSSGAGFATVEGKAAAGGATGVVVGTSVVDVRSSTEAGKVAMGARAAKMDSVTTVEALKARAIADLVAFWVANPGKEEFKAKVAEAKALLLAALPILDTFDQRYAVGNLDVSFEGTDVTIDSLTTQTLGTGLTKAAHLMFWADAKGMSIKSGKIPAWANPLVPSRASFQVDVSGHDLEQASREAVELVDAGDQAAVTSRFLALGERFQTRPTVFNVMPTGFGNDLYSISVEGVGNVTKASQTARFKVAATGIPRIESVLAGTKDPQAVQLSMMLGMAKSMASMDASGAATWILEYDGAKLSVNGRPLR